MTNNIGRGFRCEHDPIRRQGILRRRYTIAMNGESFTLSDGRCSLQLALSAACSFLLGLGAGLLATALLRGCWPS